MQQAGRAGRDQQPAEVLVLRLACDANNPQVAADVKSACDSGCLRENLLKVFSQPKKPSARCCSTCHPPPTPREIVPENGSTVKIQRIAGKLRKLRADLRTLTEVSVPSSIFSPSVSILSTSEMDAICRAWDTLKSEQEIAALLRRRRLPNGIMAALEVHRKRVNEPKEPKEAKEAKKTKDKEDKEPKKKGKREQPTVVPENLMGSFKISGGIQKQQKKKSGK